MESPPRCLDCFARCQLVRGKVKVQFFKDFSKLSETSDLFIVETDQFGFIDGNGNSYF